MSISFRKMGVFACLLLLTSCTRPLSRTHSAQTAKSQSFAPNMVSDYNPSSSAERVKYNVPSAPLDTPLCGSALQERAQTGGRLYGQSLSSGNQCVLNACFQPLTGTYIAQTGNPVVCR